MLLVEVEEEKQFIIYKYSEYEIIWKFKENIYFSLILKWSYEYNK